VRVFTASGALPGNTSPAPSQQTPHRNRSDASFHRTPKYSARVTDTVNKRTVNRIGELQRPVLGCYAAPPAPATIRAFIAPRGVTLSLSTVPDVPQWRPKAVEACVHARKLLESGIKGLQPRAETN